jgi:hypothetical protein
MKKEGIYVSATHPYARRIEVAKSSPKLCPEKRKFKVLCHVGDTKHLELASDAPLVQIEQRIRREGKEEMWISLQVKCKEQENGSLVVEVVLCNPDWDEPRRVALIQSNPADPIASTPSLRCDLEPKDL